MSALPLEADRAAGRVTRFLHAIAGAGVRFVRAQRHRRQIEELMRLDDRLLRDIGVTRLDVLHALSAPLSTDPSRSLARRHDDVRRSGGL